jgi:hypothetical protein
MKAYAPYHHLYAVAMCFAISSNQPDRVPSASKSLEAAQRTNMVEEIVKVAGLCLNMALETAANEPQAANRVFSPQNWVKSKVCLAGINGAVRQYFKMTLPMLPDIKKRMDEATVLPVEAFEYRLSAD